MSIYKAASRFVALCKTEHGPTYEHYTEFNLTIKESPFLFDTDLAEYLDNLEQQEAKMAFLKSRIKETTLEDGNKIKTELRDIERWFEKQESLLTSKTSKPRVCQKTISAVNPETSGMRILTSFGAIESGLTIIASCYDVAGGTMEIKMTIIYEKADGLIQASVAELPGAISLGADVDEARRNLDEAIEMVLEGNRLLAEDVPREKISSEEIAFRAA